MLHDFSHSWVWGLLTRRPHLGRLEGLSAQILKKPSCLKLQAHLKTSISRDQGNRALVIVL